MAVFYLKPILSLLIMAITISCVVSARVLLDDDKVAAPAIGPGGSPGGTAIGSTTTGTSTPIGTITTGTSTPIGTTTTGTSTPIDTTTTGTSIPIGTTTTATSTPIGTPTGSSIPGGSTTSTLAPGGTTSSAIPAVTTPTDTDDHLLTFFMHDILGGSHPSALAVTGIVANPAVGGQVPFAKPNGAVLPVNNGVPTNNGNAGIVNNNNVPFLTGLSGFPTNILSNNNNNGNNIIGGMPGFPVLNSAQFPSGTTLQSLMFGTMTVFNDELTEGHELGSGLVGKAQGFYISSSEDGSSLTMAFNVMFTSGSYADSLSFFGVHRTAVAESHLAIMGGTGKYVNAKGFAKVKTVPTTNVQLETDGMETLLQITVYLAY